MSRRAANFTQADVARALRAAQQVGGDWEIVIEGKRSASLRARQSRAILIS